MKERLQIVIVEDEPAILRLIKNTIADMKELYEIVGTAYNGKSAWEILERKDVDIVITDIRMPIMTGLELIRLAQEANLDIKFILLTGFEKFEYAQEAIELGVSHYLLKPIQVDKLKDCLNRLKIKIIVEREKKQLDFIRTIYLEKKATITELNLKHLRLVYLTVFYGALGTNNMYKNLHENIRNRTRADYDFIDEMENKYNRTIFRFQGLYLNEYVFAVFLEDNQESNINNLQKDIFEQLCNSEVSVTLCTTGVITDISKANEVIRNMYISVNANLKYCKNTLLTPLDEIRKNEIESSPFICNKINAIKNMQMEKKDIKKFTKEISTYWEEKEVTQLELQIDLKYLFRYFLNHSYLIAEMPDDNELLCYSYNYKEFEASLCKQIEKLVFPEWNRERYCNRSTAIVREVKQYLNKNFTAQITYKKLRDKFGYNERYIAQIFKEEEGITPGKYVLEKRMQFAQNLLKEKNNTLLKDISEVVGYEDPLYFSRVFQSYTGMSPSAFAKKYKN